MSRVFRCSHSDPRNRIEPRYFVPWIRYYLRLNLPRLIHGGDVRHIESANCAGELCSAQHKDGDSHVIGPTADHLASCPTAMWARLQVHNELRDLFSQKTNQTGALSHTEVRAKVLLLHQYSDQALKGMNPKRKTSDNKARSAQLLDLTKQLEESRDDPDQFRSTPRGAH